MKRFFKGLAWIVGVIAVLLAAALLYIFLVFDPNKYKADIIEAVHNATGRDLTIQGDLQLSLFPWLGVSTGAMSLSNPPEFGQEPFAQIKGAAIKVKLLPLLKKDVEADTVILHGFYLHLIRTVSGKGNWDDLSTQSEKSTQATPSKPSASAAVPASFAIGGIRIQNATVIWDDRQSATRYDLNDLSLNTGPISLTAPVTLSLATEIKSTAPALIVHLELSSQAQYDFDTQRLRLSGLKLSTIAKGKDLPVDEAKLTLRADADLRIPEKQYHLSRLQLHASASGERIPGKQIDAVLDTNVDLDLNKETLALTPLSLEALKVKIKGAVQGQELLASPQFTGDLNVEPFNLRDLLNRFSEEPLPTADKTTLGTASASLKFKASQTDADIEALDLSVDQTRIGGSARVHDFSHPAYRFKIDVDKIDADRYLPPSAAGKTEAATPATAAAGAVELPLDTLRSLDVDGALTVGELKIAKLKLKDIKVGVKASAGVIHARPLEARLYNGSYRGDVSLDARGKAVQFGINERLNGIEIGPLTQDLLQKDLVAGNGDIHLQLTGTGLSLEDLKQSISGNIGFSLQNGRVNGVNLLDMIQKDYVKYVQTLSIDAGQLNQTVFSKFAATASIDKGLITTNDLILNSAQLEVKGRGKVNLVDENLAMHLNALPKGQLAKQLGKFNDTAIPIRIEGTLTTPKFVLDLDEVIKQQVKAQLEAEKQKAKAELQKKVDEEKAKVQQKLKQQQEEAEKKLQKQIQNKLQDLFK